MIINLLNLFFPKVCYGCSSLLVDGEIHICTICRHELPLTNYHFNDDEMAKKMLYGRVKLENATALLKFQKKGRVQHLIHGLKYKGQQSTGAFLGKWLGAELKETDSYKNVDIVVPVPLHKRKLRKRGYNQVTKFGQEIALALQVPFIEDALIKITKTKTQVFKTRISRWNNENEIFNLIDLQHIKNKHILLVDDIITTGATIEACANELLKAKGVKISVATMAIA